jgi:hypothetical protein
LIQSNESLPLVLLFSSERTQRDTLPELDAQKKPFEYFCKATTY